MIDSSNDTELLVIKKKVKMFYDSGLKVHINLKNKKYIDGHIASCSEEFFMVQEATGISTYDYSEVFEINNFQPKQLKTKEVSHAREDPV